MSKQRISNEELVMLRRLSESASRTPWRAMIEGRDHSSGDSFVMIGDEGNRDEDMYVTRDSGPATAADLDLIAAARTYLPYLLDEIEQVRKSSDPG